MISLGYSFFSALLFSGLPGQAVQKKDYLPRCTADANTKPPRPLLLLSFYVCPHNLLFAPSGFWLKFREALD